MVEVKCPNCSKILEVQHNKKAIVCQNCLTTTGKEFIMVEQRDCQYKNLGGGFFEKK